MTEHMGALVSLTAMEIVLGVDNIVFISILVARAEESKRALLRRSGLALALFARLALLFSISWIMGLTRPWFEVLGREVSGKNLILWLGGLFLIAKATHEIHDKLESVGESTRIARKAAKNPWTILAQVILLDIVFSLDSVITAVGMAKEIWVMVVAMVVSVGVMLAFSGSISEFVERHPTVKMLALAFLIMIGMMLFLDGMGVHVSKGYIYFAMAFSLCVEFLNMRYRRAKDAGTGRPT